ncbi:hypothetical protein T02_13582 [Trichinella nativa]|uniref:Uncharacterized protein n=1 Tax=Trichinella nativa TaxID=6335 RepID=A0A0V1L8Q3_9BILA|nr:hypothetical protein T02_13582 [Trichinella nativa]
MVRGSAGTSSSSASRTSSSSNPSRLCVGATYCRTLACYTYFADLFAQGLDLSGRTRILHNVLVGVPAAMHSDGSLRHANVIAKIATNSMQIFALSQLPGYLPPANTTANMGVHNSEGIPVICRQEIRITISAPIMPLDAVAIVNSHEMTSQCLVRELAVWSYGRIRLLASQWANHRLGNWESCPYSHLFLGSLENFEVGQFFRPKQRRHQNTLLT